MMNEELLKKVTEIMDQFFREELGNRLSQFSMISFKEMVLNEIRQHKIIKSEMKKDDKK